MLRDCAYSIIDPALCSAYDAATDNTSQCIDAANQIVAPVDDKTIDIAKNWNPPPTFSPGQIRQIVASTMTFIQSAQNAVDQAMAQPNANQSDLMNAGDELARHGQQAIDYTTAANQADAAGSGIVNAPNIKQWVINAMNASSNAMVAAYVVSCTTPWWLDALSSYQDAFDQAWLVVKNVVGAVISAGEIIVHAGEGAAAGVAWTARALAWITGHAPLLTALAVGGVGVVAYRKYHHRLSGLLHRGHDHDEDE